MSKPPVACCGPEGCEPVVSRRTFLLSSAALVTAMAARPLRAAEDRRGYADALRADPDLSGYWRFDGDLQDVLGKSNATGGASASFVQGALAEGQAIQLVPHDPVAIADTDHLRGRSATLSLFFKMTAAPTGEQHPVLLAESAGQHARYVVGVTRPIRPAVPHGKREGGDRDQPAHGSADRGGAVVSPGDHQFRPGRAGLHRRLRMQPLRRGLRVHPAGAERGRGDDPGGHAGRGLGVGRSVRG